MAILKTAGLVLLLLLKIIGITLLLLLLFLLIAFFLILFVPVRYQGTVTNNPSHTGLIPGKESPFKHLKLQIRATWLLHFIHISINYGPQGMESTIRAAGIDIPKFFARLAKRREAKQARKSGKKHARQDTYKEPDRALKQENGQAQENPCISKETPGTMPEKDTEEKTGAQESYAGGSSKKTGSHKKQKKGSGRRKRKKTLSTHHRPAPEEKKNSIREKIGQIKKEIKDEVNRNAVTHLLKEACRLLKSYKPRKLKADITFSLANPAMTGDVLGLISLMPFVYRHPCSILPDFESDRLYLEGEIMAQGKISVCVFLLGLLRLVRDKQFMQVARRLSGRGR